MTRFARAKGSKASNLKDPEDSTPWEVMKEHMLKAKQENEDTKKREEAEQQRIENYNNFLKEHKVQKRKVTWCEFPNAQPSKKPTISTQNEDKNNKNNKDKKSRNNNKAMNLNCESVGDKNDNLEKQRSKKEKKKYKEKSNTVDTNEDNNTENSHLNATLGKKKKKNKSFAVEKNAGAACPSQNSKDENVNKNNGTDEIQNDTKKHNKNKQLQSVKAESSEDARFNNSTNDNNKHIEKKQQKQNLKRKEKRNRRKPLYDQSFQLIINGKEVELVRYDGFPIMKKDAERLNDLKNNMIKKGIPKSEVQRTMKLERRRAEKALARVKRDVCYNCRKGGHNLSDCPDLRSNLPGVDAPEGICFKCGSTEHRQFECKVQRDKEFRFATCFICKESGHIARQCPDNPKGLYPNGGGCKLCGDVTHLRKDCPTVQNKKEETSIKLPTFNDDNIEDIGQQVKPVSQETAKKPKKIKF